MLSTRQHALLWPQQLLHRSTDNHWTARRSGDSFVITTLFYAHLLFCDYDDLELLFLHSCSWYSLQSKKHDVSDMLAVCFVILLLIVLIFWPEVVLLLLYDIWTLF